MSPMKTMGRRESARLMSDVPVSPAEMMRKVPRQGAKAERPGKVMSPV